MSCLIDNNAFELVTRKRKRESGKFDTPLDAHQPSTEVTPVAPLAKVIHDNFENVEGQAACFTNTAFSSTPKKAIGKRLLRQENRNQFFTNPCLEVKSIADIAQKNLDVEIKNEHSIPENPYEVVRKPPKKKKRRTEIEEACFENPALNLELPEKQFNPFEVRRPNASFVLTETKKGFVNEALNLRGQDIPAARNPFEIPRCSAVSLSAANPIGVENLALEPLQPSNLKIGLPFAPTLGCRIDFKNISLSQLTPSKLLAEKLVFSPVPVHTNTPKRSLGSINEETMDIGKELDRYQLELENSINEAKLRKSACTHQNVAEEIVFEVEQKITFSKKLTEIVEEEDEKIMENEVKKFSNQSGVKEINKVKIQQPQEEEKVIVNNAAKEEILPLFFISEAVAGDKPSIRTCESVGTLQSKTDLIYSSDDNDNFDDIDELNFKAPTPFVRTYRRAEPPAPKTTVTIKKESQDSLDSVESVKSYETEPKTSNNVKNIIRNSIRKLIHPNASLNQTEIINKSDSPNMHPEKLASAPTTFMSSIRHSLRRKPPKQQLMENENVVPADISIIDSSERTMKFKSNLLQTEFAKIEDLTNEKKHSLRSSLRKSTREVRNQFLKTVFNKNQDGYAFKK